MPKYQKSDRVRIQKPDSVQHERTGIIVGYKQDSSSYLIDLDGQSIEVAEEYLVDATFDWGCSQ